MFCIFINVFSKKSSHVTVFKLMNVMPVGLECNAFKWG